MKIEEIDYLIKMVSNEIWRYEYNKSTKYKEKKDKRGLGGSWGCVGNKFTDEDLKRENENRKIKREEIDIEINKLRNILTGLRELKQKLKTKGKK